MKLGRRLRPVPVFGRQEFPGPLLHVTRGAIAVAFAVAACLTFPMDRPSVGPEYQVGAVQKETVIAPFTFKVLKDQTELRRERADAAAAVPPVFDYDDAATARVTARFDSFLAAAERIRGAKNLSPLSRRLALGRLDVPLSEGARNAILAAPRRDDVLRVCSDLLAELLEAGVLDHRGPARLGVSRTVAVLHGENEQIRSVLDLFDASEVQRLATRRGRQLYGDGERSAALVEMAALFAEPNLRYNAVETERRRQLARDGVADFEGLVLKDELIISGHERITAEHVLKLESLRHAIALQAGVEGGWRAQRPQVGRLLLSLLITGGFAVLLRLHRPRVFADVSSLVLLAASGAITLAGAAIVLGVFDQSRYLIPTAAAPILIAMTLDDRLALLATITLALLAATLGDLGIAFAVVTVLTGLAGILSVRHLHRRRDFYRTMLLVSATYVAAIGALTLAESGTMRGFLEESAAGIASSLLSVGLVSFVLPVVEGIFGVTTDVSLLELADLNRPLLRRMMIEAPGTYHHSMVVGQLAEAAADSVGADPLLARVMAYYHDIGKIEKPEYFVENLTPGTRNRHERLTPTMSCLILESHVKEGIELAKQERLPPVLVDAIPEHHGTGLMSFFYHKALESDPDIDEQDYRYPGPKPRSKETAILMLADGVEAASRSLAEPTPSRIRSVVKRIIDARVNEGQLDECNLTIEELAKVRESFVRVLTGIFHGRVQYPQAVSLDEPAPPRPAVGRGRNGGDLPRKRAEAD